MSSYSAGSVAPHKHLDHDVSDGVLLAYEVVPVVGTARKHDASLGQEVPSLAGDLSHRRAADKERRRELVLRDVVFDHKGVDNGLHRRCNGGRPLAKLGQTATIRVKGVPVRHLNPIAGIADDERGPILAKNVGDELHLALYGSRAHLEALGQSGTRERRLAVKQGPHEPVRP